MKVFLVACLAVAVMAESDPNLILAPGMYHSGLYNGMVNPIVRPISYIQPTVQILKEQEKQEEKKVEVEMKSAEKIQPFVYKTFQPTIYGSPLVHSQYINTPFINTPVMKIGPQSVQKNGEVESILHKRDADADPWTVYNTGFYNQYLGVPAVRSVVSPYVANKATFFNPYTMDVTGKYSNDAILPNNYAQKGLYVARAPGSNTVHVAKREADPLTVIASPYSGLVNPIVNSPYMANPIVSSPYMVNSMVYSGYAHQPIVYSNPAVVAKTVAKPIAKNAALGMEGVLEGKTVADDAWQFTPNYAGKGMYEARTPGTEHRARRDADPLTIYRSGLYNSYYPQTVVRSSLYSSLYPRTVVRTSPFFGY